MRRRVLTDQSAERKRGGAKERLGTRGGRKGLRTLEAHKLDPSQVERTRGLFRARVHTFEDLGRPQKG